MQRMLDINRNFRRDFGVRFRREKSSVMVVYGDEIDECKDVTAGRDGNRPGARKSTQTRIWGKQRGRRRPRPDNAGEDWSVTVGIELISTR